MTTCPLCGAPAENAFTSTVCTGKGCVNYKALVLGQASKTASASGRLARSEVFTVASVYHSISSLRMHWRV